MAKALIDKYKNFVFMCPGCLMNHGVPVEGPRAWRWDGSLDRPTLTPSLLTNWTYGPEHTPEICHLFIKDGQIQYLADCTHELKGQTINMMEV